MADALRVALFGYGLAGRVFHAPLIAATPGLELATIVTSDAKRQAQAAADHPRVRVVSRPEEVWASASKFDLAVIATANASHVPLAEAALDAQLHAVVDKPLAGTEREALDLIAKAAAAERQLFVFQNRRFDGDFLTVRSLVDSGELGHIHRFESRFERFRPVATGGWREQGGPDQLPGLLYDLGAHLVDQALVLLGEARSVFAIARTVRHAQSADDDTQIIITHTSGAVSILWASAVAAFTDPRMRVLGTLGGYEINGLDGQESALRDGVSPASDTYGVSAESEWGTLRKRGADGSDEIRRVATLRAQWPQFYRDVVHFLSEGKPAPVLATEVLEQLRVLQAAQQSAASGEVVSVEPND